MRIAVIGCGGIGGVLCANLIRAGHDVVPVVGRQAIADAIVQHGLRVRELDGTEWSARPARAPLLELPSASQAQSVGAIDLAIVVTQNPALEAALASLRPHLEVDAPVVVCQNGLPEHRAARVVDAERIVGCVVGWGASMVEPGLYQRTSAGGLQLGRLVAGGADPEPIARLLDCASPNVAVEDLLAVRWSKLAINCVTSTLGAIGGDRLGKLLSHRFVRRLAIEIFAEVKAVAEAEGVKPRPVGGTFALADVAITDDERRAPYGTPSLAYKHSLLLAVGFKYRRMRSSMLYALEKGRPPEIDFLNGEVTTRGRALGIPTPVCDAVVAAVHAIARKDAQSSLEHLQKIANEVVYDRRLQSQAA